MNTPAPPSVEDYEAIADAVMETERGRWFLREFARRNRVTDTAEILDALARLEARLAPSAPSPEPSAPAVAPGLARLAALGVEIKAALTAAKPAQQRIALALEGVAALEGAIGASAEANDPADSAPSPKVPALAAPKRKETIPAIGALAITPPLEQAMDLVDVAFYEIDRGAAAVEVDTQDIPSAWAWAAQERADDADARVAPTPGATITEQQPAAPPPRKAGTLLESLSEAEKASLFA